MKRASSSAAETVRTRHISTFLPTAATRRPVQSKAFAHLPQLCDARGIHAVGIGILASPSTGSCALARLRPGSLVKAPRTSKNAVGVLGRAIKSKFHFADFRVMGLRRSGSAVRQRIGCPLPPARQFTDLSSSRRSGVTRAFAVTNREKLLPTDRQLSRKDSLSPR